MRTRNDLRETFAAIIEGLDAAQKAATPALHKAVEKWAQGVKTQGRANLARPSWLLTSSIVDKVVDYSKRGKIWGMTGFERTTNDPRSPGVYGQYHEAGWAPDRKVVKTPDHFLRRAKLQQGATLKNDVDAALQEVLDYFNNTVRRRGGKS